MGKRQQQAMKGQAETETATNTESETYETGEGSEVDDEVLPGTSHIIMAEIVQDEEPLDDTTILREHGEFRESVRRRRPQSPQRTRYTSPPVKLTESEPEHTQGDQEGLYKTMKTAFTEMTIQLVNTIQAAFRGVRGTPVK